MFWQRRNIEDYLYISVGKIAGIDAGPTSVQVAADVSFSLGIDAAKLQFGGHAIDERPVHMKYLEQIRPILEACAYSYRDPMVEIGDWVKFKTTMHWATMHPDSGRDGEDRVVVFVTPYPQPEGGDDLILLGSTCHLTDRTGSVGRMGSNSDTLYEIASSPDLDTRPCCGLDSNAAEAACQLDRIVTEEGPRWQAQQVEGFARVLHVVDSINVTRSVVATPLYVKLTDPTSFRSRRLARKRRKAIEKHGVEFIPGKYRKLKYT
ncbi:SAVMC3_10250 family protein [Brevibacterium oceani]|uniref:SAVMC3_10250 family protein n=1 Tax=Brevibacterium oceani TaxID=358099 RepID=UPI001B32A5D0|nr:SAVMC3_10250 family protein [Brevibacterium oceani]